MNPGTQNIPIGCNNGTILSCDGGLKTEYYATSNCGGPIVNTSLIPNGECRWGVKLYCGTTTRLQFSNDYICQDDGRQCYAYYDNGSCIGEPIVCDDWDPFYDHVVDCSGTCDSYVKFRWHVIDFGSGCDSISDNHYIQEIEPIGCDGTDGIEFICNASSVTINDYGPHSSKLQSNCF